MLMFFASSRLNSQTLFTQIHQIDSILVHYVDFDLMTIADIDCDNFESSLVYEKVMLRDSMCIVTFRDIFLKDKCKTKHPIDVRCKIYIFTPKGIEIACLGKSVLLYNDNSYQIDSLFIDRLKELISKGERPINDTIIDYAPVLLVDRTVFHENIRQKCLPIMKKEKVDSLKIIVDFCIDREGHTVDIAIKGWKNQYISDSLRYEITHLFQENLIWSSSKERPPKIRKILPLLFVSD